MPTIYHFLVCYPTSTLLCLSQPCSSRNVMRSIQPTWYPAKITYMRQSHLLFQDAFVHILHLIIFPRYYPLSHVEFYTFMPFS
jgi:hypothetical protein